jgi:phosphoribosyl 1,2-cyclic phosphodiesterase
MQLALDLDPGEAPPPAGVFRFYNFASGSAGNATLVESPAGDRVLVDCGLGLREIERHLQALQIEPRSLACIFVTHEHGDHLGSAVAFSATHRVRLYMSAGTRAGACAQRDRRLARAKASEPSLAEQLQALSSAGLLTQARSNQAITVGALQLRPFAVPHDTPEPLQLRVECGEKRLGILTDLGHATTGVKDALAGVHALLLEANHCSDMLARGPYPEFLKRRVGGGMGHLANAQSAALLADLAHDGLHSVLAAHLSHQNNDARLALEALRAALPAASACDVRTATQAAGSGGWITV